MENRYLLLLAAGLMGAFIAPPACTAQTRPARAQITSKIDANALYTLRGNTRSEANAQNDRGLVADSFPMEHMLLQMQRPAEREQAVRQFVDQLHDPKSPNFHQWLSAAEFGHQFGPAQSDLDAVTAWLKSQGFQVNLVYPNGMTIDFSGTAGGVRTAFHTEIHSLMVNGEQHVANTSDPRIPAALAPAVAGVVSMHDFRPHAMKKTRSKFTFGSGANATQALVPEDLATIYNLTPLFAAGYTGQGQTIAVIEDSDMFSEADWSTFRNTFGLAQYTTGSLATVHPGSNCADPGVANGDDSETTLDAEWASAAAPGAAIQVAACASTRSTFGGLIALANLLNAPAGPPQLVSVSYGTCEAENGASSNLAFNALYQQAAAQGVSVFVAAGDEGAASCDGGSSAATHGIGVSAFASTPYNVAVGGTDFGDLYLGTVNAFWSATNDANHGSAQSYVPEIPWNDSCAGALLASIFSFSTTFGSGGFCDSSTAKQDGLLEVVGGSGGPSGCATGSPAVSGVVGGSCKGYDKPSWQTSVTGIPNDGVRDIPDVSLFAGDGVWGHYYVFCWSNTKHRAGGAACDGDPSNWSGGGGTSFASPIMAGIQALVNQRVGGAQGNPNYVYYQMGASQFSGQGLGGCNSTTGPASGCIFNNVTQGDIAVNCGGTANCFGSTSSGFGRRSASSGDGALSSTSDSYTAAFSAAPGWNFATGIGSVNAYNLVMNWPGGGQ